MRLLVGILAVAVLAGRDPSFAAESYHYEPEIVRLSGTVVCEDHFGPPGWGEDPETDRKLVAQILVLDKPIDVIGNPEDEIDTTTYHNVKRIQLAYAPTTALRGVLACGGKRHVSVRGRLYQSHTAYHFTHVLIFVRDATLSR
jgi:hypothetical protein